MLNGPPACAVDWRLVLDYIDVLAWPAVVLFALFVFRGRLHDLFERMTEFGGAGFSAKFQSTAKSLSAGTTTVVQSGKSSEEDTALPITPVVKPKSFDWSAPPSNLATFSVRTFSETTEIVEAYKGGKAVDVDVQAAPRDVQYQVLTYVAGIVRGSGGYLATDERNSFRFAAVPPDYVEE